VRQLLLNNQATDIIVKDSYLGMGQTRYLFNSRDNGNQSESNFTFIGNTLRGE
jgi:hypothetical protein